MSRPELRSNNVSHIIDVSVMIVMCVGLILHIFPGLKIETLLYVAAVDGKSDVDGRGRQAMAGG
jgi:hypothetical protein